jgi:hypothetical protein
MFNDRLWLNLLGLAGLFILALWLSSCGAPDTDVPFVGKGRSPAPPEEERTVHDSLADTEGLGYDTTNEKTFSADVLGFRAYDGGDETSDFVELVCAVDGREYGITLAPSQYLDSIGLKLSKNDKVTVTACGLGTDAEEIIVARKLEVGGETFELRDRWGAPLWRDGAPLREGERVFRYKYVPPKYTLAPESGGGTKEKKEPLSDWEGDLQKKKWHERGELLKKKWAEGHPE